VTFNQPVAAAGSDPANAPAAFSLEPAANGWGEWINPSTYLFYPQTALAEGTAYTVHLNSGLVSSAGQPLEAVATDFVMKNRPSSIIRRAATVEEVANLVVYTASPQASATTGAALRVDGGVVDTIA